ncbi:hypothetical protein Pcinc_038421 [Petrolisthes cinctipes]|uniref:Uncharacterized protein n=1 Tax=Petrolisthes cinctipes TaxID=88211 RepID=A0AAE1BR13_PETCI|nr:hypothetical protein Pcinc_038421 [Petrolisthes cinctipes]
MGHEFLTPKRPVLSHAHSPIRLLSHAHTPTHSYSDSLTPTRPHPPTPTPRPHPISRPHSHPLTPTGLSIMLCFVGLVFFVSTRPSCHNSSDTPTVLKPTHAHDSPPRYRESWRRAYYTRRRIFLSRLEQAFHRRCFKIGSHLTEEDLPSYHVALQSMDEDSIRKLKDDLESGV